MITKKQLAISLSKFEAVKNPKEQLEQYALNSEVAAELLWHAYTQGDVEGKAIADFGCGNGIFGGGALMLDAKKVYFVDKDKESVEVAKKKRFRW